MAKKSGGGDRLLSFAAIFISLLTLGVFVYQTELIRKQQYMSVYPHLSIGNYSFNSSDYKLVLQNSGIGPALIHSITLKYDGKILKESLRDYLGNRISDTLNFYYADINPGQLIPHGSNLQLIEVADGKIETFHRLQELLGSDKLEYEIVYKSIYDERWKIWLGSTSPLKLN